MNYKEESLRNRIMGILRKRSYSLEKIQDGNKTEGSSK